MQRRCRSDVPSASTSPSLVRIAAPDASFAAALSPAAKTERKRIRVVTFARQAKIAFYLERMWMNAGRVRRRAPRPAAPRRPLLTRSIVAAAASGARQLPRVVPHGDRAG